MTIDGAGVLEATWRSDLHEFATCSPRLGGPARSWWSHQPRQPHQPHRRGRL